MKHDNERVEGGYRCKNCGTLMSLDELRADTDCGIVDHVVLDNGIGDALVVEPPVVLGIDAGIPIGVDEMPSDEDVESVGTEELTPVDRPGKHRKTGKHERH